MSACLTKLSVSENKTGPAEKAQPGNPEWKQQEAQQQSRILDWSPKESRKDSRTLDAVRTVTSLKKNK